jgi:hypothetical protein
MDPPHVNFFLGAVFWQERETALSFCRLPNFFSPYLKPKYLQILAWFDHQFSITHFPLHYYVA